VAVIRYADRADVSITLNRYNDISSLQQAIRSLTLLGGGSNLATALQVLRSQVFASNDVRPGTTLIAGIVTDRLTCNSQIIREANNLRNNLRVSILGVAVTSTRMVDTGCLSQVVSPNGYVEVPHYSVLNYYASEAARYTCGNTVPTSTPSPRPDPGTYVGAKCIASHSVLMNVL